MEYRIQVLPEAVSVTDYASMQQERTQLMQSMAQLLQVVLPIGQAAPQMLPFLLQIIQWMFAGYKGASTMEGIFDQAVQAAEGMAKMAMQKAMQPAPPDPKVEAAKVKAQAEAGKAQASQQQTQLETQKAVAEHQVDMQRIGMEAQADQKKHEMTLQQTEAQLRADVIRSALPNDKE